MNQDGTPTQRGQQQLTRASSNDNLSGVSNPALQQLNV